MKTNDVKRRKLRLISFSNLKRQCLEFWKAWGKGFTVELCILAWEQHWQPDPSLPTSSPPSRFFAPHPFCTCLCAHTHTHTFLSLCGHHDVTLITLTMSLYSLWEMYHHGVRIAFVLWCLEPPWMGYGVVSAPSLLVCKMAIIGFWILRKTWWWNLSGTPRMHS